MRASFPGLNPRRHHAKWGISTTGALRSGAGVDRIRLPRKVLRIHPWAFLVFGVDVAATRTSDRKGAVGLVESEANSALQARVSRLPDERLLEALHGIQDEPLVSSGDGTSSRASASRRQRALDGVQDHAPSKACLLEARTHRCSSQRAAITMHRDGDVVRRRVARPRRSCKGMLCNTHSLAIVDRTRRRRPSSSPSPPTAWPSFARLQWSKPARALACS